MPSFSIPKKAPEKRPVKTIAYIDGFNLYFGCLERTPYRWLDVSQLVRNICHIQDTAFDVIAVNYYTADIKAKLSPNGEQSQANQRDYLKALEVRNASTQTEFNIIKGKYHIGQRTYYAYQEPINFAEQHDVWVSEEKQTDVAIGIDILCDVLDQKCEQIVVVSNDSDLAPALRRVRSRWPGIKIGIIAPIRENIPRAGGKTERRSSKDLDAVSDWTREIIRNAELADAQLPSRVITRKRPILKPRNW